ncbi:CheR family methyltransferase [Novosphingobium sp.]|uniref:CheR family methyltransferase n=1 Tax=Novosphingobium sp. TaxID=1874826 RepID=UPI003B51C824
MTMGPTPFAQALPGISPGIYDAPDFHAIADIAYREAGLVLSEGKAMLVYSRLAALVRTSGCATFGSYVMRIREDAHERGKAIGALTTQHTFFFREAHQFDHLRDALRPQLIARAEQGRPVRLWSAGCSTGEEAWSLAMTLLGPDRVAGERIARHDIRILASDIAAPALATAQAARYRAADLKSVPDDLALSWATIDGDNARIAPELHAIVRFRALNLLAPWPMAGRFDAIFCRNVMIYFDTPTRERLLSRFAEILTPGGTLYIGHSERMTGAPIAQFTQIAPMIYRAATAA